MNHITNVKEQFKKRFAELRAETGLSQLKLGKLLNLSPATIGYYENGDRVPDIVTAARIADYFSVSVDYLLGLSDVKSTEQDMKIACEVTGLSEKAIECIYNFVMEEMDNGEKIPNEFLSEIISAPKFNLMLHAFYKYTTTFYNSSFDENGKEQLILNTKAMQEYLQFQGQYAKYIKNFVFFLADTRQYRNMIINDIIELSKEMLENQDLLKKIGMLNGENLMKTNHECDDEEFYDE